MKIRLILIVQILMAFSVSSFSQDYFLYVYTVDERLKPNTKEIGKSNDESLNKIFEDFGVMSYYQSFPKMKTVELRNYYSIYFTGDVDSLESLLKKRNLFERVERCDYYKPAACGNPVSINDNEIASGLKSNKALELLDAQCAWTITKGNNNIIVGVIDTEFDTNHEDLVNTFAGVVGTRTHPDVHGTRVSSCVATGTNNYIGIAGIGYNTRVRGYYVNGGTIWDGIQAAYSDGVKIINVSWTGMGATVNVQVVREMVDNGVVFILGAGNNHDYIYHSSYANIPGVINVSGVDSTNNHSGTLGANDSGKMHAHNEYIDVCALSVRVTVCVPENGYEGTHKGTSYAAPQVAGVVALMRSINPNLSPAEVENIIKATAVPIADAHLFPSQLGAGRVNAYNAVKQTLCILPNKAISSQTINTETTVYGNTVNISNSTVTTNGKLNVTACNGVNINPSFTINAGGTLTIQVP